MTSVETIKTLLLPFGSAFGMIIGAAWVCGMIAYFTTGSPIVTMLEVGRSLRIWAMAAAMGGTFSLLEALEWGLSGNVHALLRHLAILGSAALGTWFGWWMLTGLLRVGQ